MFKKTNVDAAVKVKRYVALDQNQNVAAVVLKKIKEVITAKKEKLENDIVKLNLQIDKLINSIAESNEFTLKYINKKIT